jgi:predicted DNA repair protein MutK
MVISLNEVADEGLVSRAIILVGVAIGITLLVYGLVGLIVKMDDVGLHLYERNSDTTRKVGLPWSVGCPGSWRCSHCGGGGHAWVGGHIVLVGSDELGWQGPYALVHAAKVPSRTPYRRSAGCSPGWLAPWLPR